MNFIVPSSCIPQRGLVEVQCDAVCCVSSPTALAYPALTTDNLC